VVHTPKKQHLRWLEEIEQSLFPIHVLAIHKTVLGLFPLWTIIRIVSREKQKMKILLSGASGFLGKQLTGYLHAKNHQVFSLVRNRSSGTNEILWDIEKRMI
jgi:hypothetical protein